jgi:hypothetical protein
MKQDIIIRVKAEEVSINNVDHPLTSQNTVGNDRDSHVSL